MADSEPSRHLSLIPYAAEAREVVLYVLEHLRDIVPDSYMLTRATGDTAMLS